MQLPVIGLLVSTRVQRRLAAAGKVECALRSQRQTAWGSPDKWRHGVAATWSPPAPPAGPLGMRSPRGAPVEIEVLAVQVEKGRRPLPREALSINPALHIATLTTPYGPIELAAPAQSLPDIVQALDSPH